MMKIVWIVALLLAAGAAAFRVYRLWLREAWQRVVMGALMVMAILYIGFSPLARTKKD